MVTFQLMLCVVLSREVNKEIIELINGKGVGGGGVREGGKVTM